MDIDIRRATTSDLNLVREWVADEGVPTSLGGTYSPLAGIIDLSDPGSGWSAYYLDELVAYASLVVNENHDAIVGFIVKSSRRREGIAKTFLPLLLKQENLGSFGRIVCTPQLEDIGAQKVLTHAGFHKTGFSTEGLPIYERR